MSTNPSGIQQVALQRAITLLKAAKVEYAIRTPEGEVFGELPIVPPKLPRHGWKKQNDFQGELHYIEQVKAMQVGDVLIWVIGPERAEKFRAALAGTACKVFAKNAFMTSISGEDKGTVEILRLE